MQTLEIILTPHSVERFQERVRPALDLETAGDELARLVLAAELAPVAPPWLIDRQLQEADAYLVVGDVALPLRTTSCGYVAVTCLVRGGLSPQARARRNAHRSRRRARRRIPSAA